MLKLKCTKHPRYNGQRSPKASCDACRFIQRVFFDAGINRVEVVGLTKDKDAGDE